MFLLKPWWARAPCLDQVASGCFIGSSRSTVCWSFSVESFDLARKGFSHLLCRSPATGVRVECGSQSREFFTRWTLGLDTLGLPFTEEVEDHGRRTVHSGHCRSKVMAWHVSRGVERAGDMKQKRRHQVWAGDIYLGLIKLVLVV